MSGSRRTVAHLGDDIRVSGTAFHGPVLGKGTQNITNITAAPAREDHLGSGTNALRARDYPSAARHFRRLLALRPDDPFAHYYLALATLHGRNPCEHGHDTVEAVTRRLRAAASLDAACRPAVVAALLVQDAYLQRWGRSRRSLTQGERSLVRRVPAGRARELTEHVPAPGSVWWRALSARAEAGRGRGAR